MTQNWRNRMVVSCEDFHSREGEMHQPPLDPPVADRAPEATALTGYDQEHLVTYLRLLDADSEGADWREVSRLLC
jgi:hypothetical protein